MDKTRRDLIKTRRIFSRINGPKLFLTKTSDWKYVDDITFSEVVQENASSESQLLHDKINSWCVANDMRLNPSNCKEMIISFSSTRDLPPALSIGKVPPERVECHKVLGLLLQSNLKWNTVIEYITSKASKRLHILGVLKRNGVTITQLLSVYKAFVRSVLEYCAPVWYNPGQNYVDTSSRKAFLHINRTRTPPKQC